VFFVGAPYEILAAWRDGRETLIVVSGDKLLLRVHGWQGIHVLRPREFVNRHLGKL
jgi:hypothetical protein